MWEDNGGKQQKGVKTTKRGEDSKKGVRQQKKERKTARRRERQQKGEEDSKKGRRQQKCGEDNKKREKECGKSIVKLTCLTTVKGQMTRTSFQSLSHRESVG